MANTYDLVTRQIAKDFPQFGVQGEYNSKGWSFLVLYEKGKEPDEEMKDRVRRTIKFITQNCSIFFLDYEE